MKVLLVDGFGKRDLSRGRFEQWHRQIQNVTSKVTEGVELLVKKYNDLAEYIHLLEEVPKLDNLKQFDSLDVVILDGDLPLRPWHPRCIEVYRLIAMCVQSGKCMLACGCFSGFMLCSMNTKGIRIQLAEAFPDGGKLSDLARLKTIRNGDNFLDAETGDCYEVSESSGNWEVKFNLGIKTRRKGVTEFGQKRHSSRDVNDDIRDNGVISGAVQNCESQFSVLPESQKHQLFVGVNWERAVYTPFVTAWSLAIPQPFWRYFPKGKVLAVSDESVAIFMMTNAYGLRFPTWNAKYPVTFRILTNFLMDAINKHRQGQLREKRSQIAEYFSGSGNPCVPRKRRECALEARLADSAARPPPQKPPTAVAATATPASTSSAEVPRLNLFDSALFRQRKPPTAPIETHTHASPKTQTHTVGGDLFKSKRSAFESSAMSPTTGHTSPLQLLANSHRGDSKTPHRVETKSRDLANTLDITAPPAAAPPPSTTLMAAFPASPVMSFRTPVRPRSAIVKARESAAALESAQWYFNQNRSNRPATAPSRRPLNSYETPGPPAIITATVTTITPNRIVEQKTSSSPFDGDDSGGNLSFRSLDGRGTDTVTPYSIASSRFLSRRPLSAMPVLSKAERDLCQVGINSAGGGGGIPFVSLDSSLGKFLKSDIDAQGFISARSVAQPPWSPTSGIVPTPPPSHRPPSARPNKP